MRLVALGLILLILPVAAHQGGDHLDHITLEEVELAPGATHNQTLSFEGEEFLAEWWMLIRADVTEPTRLDIRQDGKLLARWNWGPGSQFITQEIPERGFINVTFTNVGDDSSSIRWYYDQTCDCTGKRIALDPGSVWFNIDAEEGEEVTFEFVLGISGIGDGYPENIEIQVRRLQPDGIGGMTPLETIEDTLVLADGACYPGGAWNGCVTVTFVAPYSGTQFLRFFADHDGGEKFTVMIPVQVTKGAVEESTPMPFWLLLFAVSVALQAQTRRQK